ncbi:hypothetical protein [Azospirillum griseum]|uniref:Hpr(Ser) kinase/phosphatase n=1 Tax=Azospirillum griseum TaxID=2496639 RepID=A0A431V9N0_9PROT|nr:hypothetical protein [Azospirillum griseum]RTR12230.1 hypothetical protein EJ903_25645 [Azospirillum griseum]
MNATSKISQSYRYRMSGLTVASEIPLPGAVPQAADDAVPVDAVFRLGDVPERLDNPHHFGPEWFADDQQFLLNLPDVGRFTAINGREIVISPAPGMTVRDALPFVVGTTFSALLYQRGGWLLHASAVVHRGRAFAFCGDSGAGKSTLAAALCRIGCDFVTDDVCAVDHPTGSAPLVRPDGRMLRLFPDSIRRAGLEDAVGSPVRMSIDKFHVTPPTQAPDAAPLAAIYLLGDASPARPPGIEELSGANAAQALLRFSYRRRLALAYAGQGRLALRTAALLAHVKVHRLIRQRDLARIEETVAALQVHWNDTAG